MNNIREKVKEIAREVDEEYQWSGEEKASSCGKISNNLWRELEKEGIDCEVIEGRIKGGPWGNKVRHVFVLVTEENESFIVDLSLCQFTKENAKEYGWDVFIDEEIPEIVITSEGEKFYDHYLFY